MPSSRSSTRSASVRFLPTDILTRAGIRSEFIDHAASPCDDFFAFANGNWLRTAEIPDDEVGTGVWLEVRDANKAALREIAEEAMAAGADTGSDRQLVGDFYATGLDEASVDAAGLAAIAPELAIAEHVRDREDVVRAIADLQAAAVPAGFSLIVRPDPRDSSQYRLHLQQAGLGLPDRDYYTREDAKSRALLTTYEEHVARMCALAGAQAPESRERAKLILAIESRLARASMTRVEQRDPYKVANTMPRQELAARAGGFAWDAYFTTLGVPEVELVNPRQPAFFTELAHVVDELAIDEWRVYLRWHVLRAFGPHLARPLADAAFDFYGRTLQGQKEQKPRWERVIEVVDDSVGEALGRLYVERFFPPEAKARMRDMIEHLRAALADRIRGLEWMGPDTKDAALEKLAAFGVKVGYPDSWRDYSRLRITRASYAQNVRASKRFEHERDLAKLGKPVDRGEWRMSPPTVNAYYNASLNEIVFPAGILRPPFFDLQADDACNYGAIGVVIGHEMSHGFDDAGSQYDAKGNLRNWWTAEDRASYEARTGLVVEQFDAYEPLPGQRINGRLTLGENIGDLGGVRIAYAALQRALEASGRQAPVDGYTAEQRFFLAHAQVWRSRIRDEALLVRLLTDPHSPARYRVIGPLSNMSEFHDAFECSAGSPMCRAVDRRPVIW